MAPLPSLRSAAAHLVRLPLLLVFILDLEFNLHHLWASVDHCVLASSLPPAPVWAHSGFRGSGPRPPAGCGLCAHEPRGSSDLASFQSSSSTNPLDKENQEPV